MLCSELRYDLETGPVVFRLDNLAAYRWDQLQDRLEGRTGKPAVGILDFLTRLGREDVPTRDAQRLLWCLTSTWRTRNAGKLTFTKFLSGLPAPMSPGWQKFWKRVIRLLSLTLEDPTPQELGPEDDPGKDPAPSAG